MRWLVVFITMAACSQSSEPGTSSIRIDAISMSCTLTSEPNPNFITLEATIRLRGHDEVTVEAWEFITADRRSGGMFEGEPNILRNGDAVQSVRSSWQDGGDFPVPCSLCGREFLVSLLVRDTSTGETFTIESPLMTPECAS